jgi:2,4-dienoyl-CoA reductase-like NADH-dependent reductase (Old Yellow Enzyme family)
MSAKDPLLQPFQLKHLKLKNRVLSTSHEPAYSEDGKPTLRYQLYHEEKAKGGIALTMFGGSSLVAPDSPPAFGNLYVGDDEIIPYFQALAERIHRYDCALMCQITHLGRRTSWSTGDWLPVIAPSCVREPAHRAFPKTMETEDIRRVAKAYGAAARRCREGGLDGVELEAYGHLLDSFWTPAVNRRTDEYGGSLDNRMRFSLEVLDEVRRRAGDALIVGIRMVFDEALEGGLGFEEGMRIGERLVASGTIDFVNVIKGHIDTDRALADVIPGMGTPSGPFLELAGTIRRELGIPTFHAARVNDVATARHAVREGLVDMVGMTRAHMADPHIVAKIARGEEHRIRPCVGAAYCIDRIYVGGEALCIHNPATGREATMPHVIPRSPGPVRKVVVVGAGPAGLEAARVCAERGHRVVLFEATDQPGGQLVLAAKVARRREIIGITQWLFAEVDQLGVDVRFNRYADAEEVLAEEPEVVVVATGGVPNTEFVRSGAELVASTWDVLSGQVTTGEEVLLFDDNGAHQGLSCAEYMAARGSRVELITPDRMVGQDVGGINYPAYFRAFYEQGVVMTVNHRLLAVERRGNKLHALLRNEYTDEPVERTADQVVVEHGTLPADELYFELKAASTNLGEVDIDALIAGRPQTLVANAQGRYRLFRVGDAVASRNIHAAIYDSLRLCKEL